VFPAWSLEEEHMKRDQLVQNGFNPSVGHTFLKEHGPSSTPNSRALCRGPTRCKDRSRGRDNVSITFLRPDPRRRPCRAGSVLCRIPFEGGAQPVPAPGALHDQTVQLCDRQSMAFLCLVPRLEGTAECIGLCATLNCRGKSPLGSMTASWPCWETCTRTRSQ
jgi:hypothetical protein